MEIGLDWRVAGMLVTLVVAWSGLLVAAIKWLLDRHSQHIDRRFSELEKHDTAEQLRVERLRSELQAVRIEMSRDYVRREDWIRFSGLIDAKLDKLYERFEWLVNAFRKPDETPPGGPQ